MSLRITNGLVVTQNGTREIIKADILVEDGKISKIGDVTSADETIDATGCAIIPGLINLHSHVSMTLMRGIADDVHLNEFLKKTFEVDARRTSEDIQIGAELGTMEMIRSGSTSFLDLYYSEDEIAKAVQRSGMRGYLGWAVLDEEMTTQKGNPLHNCADFISSHRSMDRITPLVAPQGIYVCSEETLVKAMELADKENTLLHMHLSETRMEVYEHQKKTGKRPVEWLDDIGFLSKRFIAAHGVWLTLNEVRTLARNDVKVVHCPVSNMKLATGGTAPLPEMFDNNMIVGLGTDGCSSNNSLDMFGEMKTCALLHKAHRWDATVLPAQKVFDMATVEGAKALDRSDEIGSIEVGKKADFAILDLKRPNMQPFSKETLVSNIVYSCKADNVRDVLVDGQVLMRDRDLVTMDEREILDKVHNAAKKLLESD